MSRHKRENPLLAVVQTYLNREVPELRDAPLQLRRLDGPPGSPCYAAIAETCDATVCPRSNQATASSQCGVLDCPLRCSMRLLLDRRGGIIQVTRSGIHWN